MCDPGGGYTGVHCALNVLSALRNDHNKMLAGEKTASPCSAALGTHGQGSTNDSSRPLARPAGPALKGPIWACSEAARARPAPRAYVCAGAGARPVAHETLAASPGRRRRCPVSARMEPSKVEKFSTADRGNGLRALAPLRPGELLFRSDPLAYTVSKGSRGVVCDRCLLGYVSPSPI